jgi:hypothetical protein
MMEIEHFKASLGNGKPPKELPLVLTALWHQAKGDWDTAHEFAQSDKSPAGSWIHAHLHRVEGDDGNAAYWYGLAGKPVCKSTLEEEWDEIVSALLLWQ